MDVWGAHYDSLSRLHVRVALATLHADNARFLRRVLEDEALDTRAVRLDERKHLKEGGGLVQTACTPRSHSFRGCANRLSELGGF